MRKFTIFLALMLFIGMQVVQAQTRTITGTVTNAEDGSTIPGVSVVVKGTTYGTTTDMQGKYSLNIPPEAESLIFSFVGMTTVEQKIGTENVVNVTLVPEATAIEGVVVTALGISREKKSLGYSTQQVSGSEVSTVKSDNFVNSLSGKVAGVQIKNNGNMGGSTNVVIRGSSSITGNNQALFVIDGVPVNNDNTNNTGQLRGRSGFDYGNAASDINPNDIESVNVLKGAAATALYGSRAANGVIIITTKKGTKQPGKHKTLGVSINSNVTTGFYEKSTFPTYQKQYGAGYGSSFYSGETLPDGTPMYGFEYVWDVNGDGVLDFTVPTYEDASMGQKFDPNISVYQWDSYWPESPNYQKATPWVAGANGPDYFLQNPLSLTNSIDVTGGGDASTFRLSYTNLDQTGLLPNSSLKRNNFLFNGSYDILKNLTVSASANYINTMGKGRNSTGYSDNVMSSFRQWMQMNVDYKLQEQLYDETGKNISWNPNNPFDLAIPAYWDNPYFQRYQNYETDKRDRIIGYLQADWKVTDYLSLMGRWSVDTYSELQEERKAVGSGSGEFGVGRPDVTSGYSRFDRSFMETNADFMARFNKNITEEFNLTALLGTNIRRNTIDQTYESTDGGLRIPGQYSLSNSINPRLAPEESYRQIGVNGIYASVSLGYKNYLYLDATIRRDQSSTLPEEHNDYYYPSVSGSFIFSNLMESTVMQLGKLRLGYAQVGNDAPWGSINDTYTQNALFGNTVLFSVPSTKNNTNLKPERTESLEAGLEMTFLQKRLGFDLSVYSNSTVDQIIPVAVSYATGYSSKYVNAGEVTNKGVELMIYGTPYQSNDFKWDIILNWARNRNEVVALDADLENLQLAALQGGVTINARKGEPYGTIQGTDYVYDSVSGKRVVGANGYYLKTSTSNEILGNINPDWTGGINNKFTYKSWAFSFLIDFQQGGSVFSLDQYYGMATGLYEETVFTNDLGNNVRDPLTDDETSGGLILDAVYADGTPNTTRVAGDDYRVFGYSRNPNAAFVYDASYIKLREVILSYSLPQTMLANSFIHGATFSLVGSNLWIISKNLPHADPEASQSAGNIQGWQSGVMPSMRNLGFTINLQF